MVQHEVLMLIAAPLLVLGRPLPLFLWAFGESARATLGRLSRSTAVAGAWAMLLSPFFAWLLHALTLWIWHAPPLFNAALRYPAVHDFQHLSFLAAALVFWAAMIESRRREQQGVAILSLFTTTIHTSVLGALITFAVRPWYSAYLQNPVAWGVTALEDQQLGGLIMWVPGSLVFVAIALALLVRWIRLSDVARVPR
jgi:cytochrome c oxidase assembly factor CtaG